MGNVSFDDGQGQAQVANVLASQPASLGMSGWLIKKGIVSSKAKADMVLLAFAVLMFSLAVYFIVRSGQFTPTEIVDEPLPFEAATFNPDGSRINN